MRILPLADSSSTSETLRSGLAHAIERFDVLANPTLLIETITSFSLVLAIILCAVGAVCLVRGWKWHRLIVLVLALLGGIALGHSLTLSMGRSMVIAIAVGLLCAALAAPMLKWTIAILAGLVGFGVAQDGEKNGQSGEALLSINDQESTRRFTHQYNRTDKVALTAFAGIV